MKKILYVITNISMPNICKVGITNSLERRLNDLNKSIAEARFIIFILVVIDILLFLLFFWIFLRILIKKPLSASDGTHRTSKAREVVENDQDVKKLMSEFNGQITKVEPL